VDERILAQRAQQSPTDHEGHEGTEGRNCFYCLEGWVFLGSLGHDGEEVVEVTAGFSEHDLHRMMHMCGLDQEFV
jgi:hypothetical protein